MKADLKAKWIAALRSGDYKQGKHYLRLYNGTFCCLGVLCEVAGLEHNGFAYDFGPVHGFTGLAGELLDAIGDDNQPALQQMNDRGASFAVIADWIEANIPAEPA